MCPSVSICRPFQTISDWNHMPSYAVGQAARILDAIARVSSHICAASVSVATSQRSIAAFVENGNHTNWIGSVLIDFLILLEFEIKPGL
jgi:hypothetical protein